MMHEALKRDLQQVRLLHRERLIVAWIRVNKTAVKPTEVCEALGLSINPTQITLKKLYELGYLSRQKIDLTYYYTVI